MPSGNPARLASAGVVMGSLARYGRRPRARPGLGSTAEQDLHDARHDADRYAEAPGKVVVAEEIEDHAAAPGAYDRAHLVDDERNAEQRGHVARAEQVGDIPRDQRND